MLVHPSLLMELGDDRRRELTAEADQFRLLALARQARRCAAAARRRSQKAGAVRGQPTGTLASCEPSAAVPAR